MDFDIVSGKVERETSLWRPCTAAGEALQAATHAATLLLLPRLKVLPPPSSRLGEAHLSNFASDSAKLTQCGSATKFDSWKRVRSPARSKSVPRPSEPPLRAATPAMRWERVSSRAQARLGEAGEDVYDDDVG